MMNEWLLLIPTWGTFLLLIALIVVAIWMTREVIGPDDDEKEDFPNG